ncbi:MAG TPA: glycoside hydrolase family 16 protein [Pyrinomonadaceae bacterium]|nr:glycoside hydrolase family 16 protein [Pyrinomonadaceae bacterium]
MKLKKHRVLFSRQTCRTVVLILLLLYSFNSPAMRRPTQTANEREWLLTWSDEFAGANGSSVDATKWAFDIGGNGWGNNELQTYTNRTTNAFLRNGSLNIKVLQEKFTGPDKITREFTSARLLTENKFTQRYGRFEARIKVPFGQGIWPAFWMLGDNIRTAGWPKCGEIDIMEYVGREPSKVFGTLHGPGYSGANGLSAIHTLSDGKKLTDDFHIFAVEWEPNVIRFYIDRVLYKTRTPGDLPIGASWVFDRPFFLILNVAVGGSFPGNPDSTTVFPQSMQVDYVRVYRRTRS